jgi:hypothetical protein
MVSSLRLCDRKGLSAFWAAAVIGTPGLYLAGVFGRDLPARFGYLLVWLPFLICLGWFACFEVVVDAEHRTITCRSPLRSTTIPLSRWERVRFIGSTATLGIGSKFVVLEGNTAAFAELWDVARRGGANPLSIPPSGPRRNGRPGGMRLYRDGSS